MIKIDLSLPRRREKLTALQFILLFVGILLGTALIVGIGLVLQWNSLNNLAGEIEELRARRDSLEVVSAEIIEYEEFHERYTGFLMAMDEAGVWADKQLDILTRLRTDLEPGMRLLSASIAGDSVVSWVLSPSNVKVARYVEALSRSGYFAELQSVPQGTKQGLIEHKVVLRLR